MGNHKKENIVLLACSATKDAHSKVEPMRADKIYQGDLFKKTLEYSDLKYGTGQRKYILSALHHILEPDTKIMYYDAYLGNFKARELKEWGKQVIDKLIKLRSKNDGDDEESLKEDVYIALAGSKYTKPISGKNGIQIMETPLSLYKGIGYQLGWLKSEIERLKKNEKSTGSLGKMWNNLTNKIQDIVSPALGSERYHHGNGPSDMDLIKEYTEKLRQCEIKSDLPGRSQKTLIKSVYPLGTKKNASGKDLEIELYNTWYLRKRSIRELVFDYEKWKELGLSLPLSQGNIRIMVDNKDINTDDDNWFHLRFA